jgi:hypothetical protein
MIRNDEKNIMSIPIGAQWRLSPPRRLSPPSHGVSEAGFSLPTWDHPRTLLAAWISTLGFNSKMRSDDVFGPRYTTLPPRDGFGCLEIRIIRIRIR